MKPTDAGRDQTFDAIMHDLNLLDIDFQIEQARADARAIVRAGLARWLSTDDASGCSPMGTNARGVAQCSDGHGDYPDACNEATS